MGYNGGAGVSGAYSFTGNDAATMFNYFANGGNMSGITFKNGWAMWGTLEGNPFLEGYDGDMYVSNTGSVVLHRAKVEQKDFFTNLANNQYFSAGHLGISESISRFGNYSMVRALNHSYINFTVLNDFARPYIGTTVAGIRMSSTVAANIGKAAKYGGVALGVVSIVATELQYADGQIGDTERIMNHIMTGVGFIPSPWTIGAALLYGAVTGGYQAITGRSIFNDMGLGPKK
ncbi:hypothetical protein [Chryseobacterium sp. PET-29]|uniref:hypothetical protein n=1 Tax=Chryseobacterium sp. PET-29 TaxID=2983267 RepID=UPI0021E5DFDC|nr:hypothetical protein [Chryseobacterium sp. PET-29]